MYAVGDTVKVRNGLIPEKRYQNVRFAPEMAEYCGKISKIAEVYHSLYHLEGCSSWWFTDEMLEPVAYIAPTPTKFKIGDKIMVVERDITSGKLIGLSPSFFSTLVGCRGEITIDNDKGRFTCHLIKSDGNSVGNWIIHQDNLVLLGAYTQPITPQSESKTTTLKPFEPAKTSTISITEVEVECCKKETYTI